MAPRKRPQTYASNAAKQAAYRRRKQWHQLVAKQEAWAQMHLHAHGHLLVLQSHATDEQRALQAELKERDFLDVLWTLQTLVSDFGYHEVYAHVLQYIVPHTDGVLPPSLQEATSGGTLTTPRQQGGGSPGE